MPSCSAISSIMAIGSGEQGQLRTTACASWRTVKICKRRRRHCLVGHAEENNVKTGRAGCGVRGQHF